MKKKFCKFNVLRESWFNREKKKNGANPIEVTNSLFIYLEQMLFLLIKHCLIC